MGTLASIRQFPVSIASGSRYLQVGSGTPWLVRGDTPWYLARLTTPNIDAYLSDRQSRGINTVIIQSTISDIATNDAGDVNFNSNYGGGSDNLTTPNTAWYNNVAYACQAAASRNMLVFLFPLYLGFGGGAEGHYASLSAGGSADAQSYGEFFGDRFKSFSNLVIVLGGDYVPSAAGLSLVKNMVDGIKATGRSDWVYSYHGGPNENSYAVDGVTAGWIASLGVPFMHWAYGYEAGFGNIFAHQQVQDCYGQSPTRPCYFGEGHYENSASANADSKLLRRQAWSAVLSGGFGKFYGHESVWRLAAGYTASLNDTGVQHEVICDAFYASREWWKLVPSTGAGLVSAGGGTVGTAGYKPRALASDGSWGAVHVTDGSSTTLDFSGFNDTKTVKWFDPTNAAISTVGTHANSGTQAYTTTGNNAAGSNDWVLVVE